MNSLHKLSGALRSLHLPLLGLATYVAWVILAPPSLARSLAGSIGATAALSAAAAAILRTEGVGWDEPSNFKVTVCTNAKYVLPTPVSHSISLIAIPPMTPVNRESLSLWQWTSTIRLSPPC